ncbi:MAG: 4Fe-4S dicluster domain-containing protein [Clostridiales bacterium]|jgi:2-oxoglutarate ferredoxin oxidoreductase subunit delta|nr:4Fe-4S dicluster domain-containing protein [Clostridiales bacterium]
MPRVTFKEDECKGCGLCVTVCPKKILAMSGDKINRKGYYPAYCADMDKCIGCAMCAIICPDVVIKVER